MVPPSPRQLASRQGTDNSLSIPFARSGRKNIVLDPDWWKPMTDQEVDTSQEGCY